MPCPPIQIAVVATGHTLARERCTTVRELFNDSLSGDLARLEVFRRVRRKHRDWSPSAVDWYVGVRLGS